MCITLRFLENLRHQISENQQRVGLGEGEWRDMSWTIKKCIPVTYRHSQITSNSWFPNNCQLLLSKFYLCGQNLFLFIYNKSCYIFCTCWVSVGTNELSVGQRKWVLNESFSQMLSSHLGWFMGLTLPDEISRLFLVWKAH